MNNYTPISDESKIELGVTYDLDLLPDHHGEYFQHPKAHLTQQDYHHVNKNIIAPWKTYEVLNTGTILLINTIMNCWKMKINEDSYHKVSFSYHIYNFIKVDFSFPRYINLVFTACEWLLNLTHHLIFLPPVPILNPKNSPSTPSPSKQPLAFDNFDISPSKKESATKQNKAGSSSSTSHKLWRSLKNHWYQTQLQIFILKGSRLCCSPALSIKKWVSTHCNLKFWPQNVAWQAHVKNTSVHPTLNHSF